MAVFFSILIGSIVALLIPDVVLLVKPVLQPAFAVTMLFVGMQNAGLGSVLALAHLGEAGAVPSAFYTALCVLTASAALPLFRKKRTDYYTLSHREWLP